MAYQCLTKLKILIDKFTHCPTIKEFIGIRAWWCSTFIPLAPEWKTSLFFCLLMSLMFNSRWKASSDFIQHCKTKYGWAIFTSLRGPYGWWKWILENLLKWRMVLSFGGDLICPFPPSISIKYPLTSLLYTLFASYYSEIKNIYVRKILPLLSTFLSLDRVLFTEKISTAGPPWYAFLNIFKFNNI